MRSKVWSIVVLLALAPAPALAQADIAGRQDALFTASDLDALDRAATLSPEQRRAARDLMLAAMADLRSARQRAQAREAQRQADAEARHPNDNDARQAEFDKPDPEAVKIPDAAALERQTYEALRSLLTPEQADRAWEPFLRHRRALVVEAVAAEPRATQDNSSLTHLDTLLREADLSPDDRAAARPILDQAFQHMDDATKRLIDAARRAAAPSAAPADVERAAELRAQAESQLRIAHARACTDIQAAISPDGRTKLLRRRVEREGLLTEASAFISTSFLERARAWSQDLSLPLRTRQQLADIHAAARADVLDLLAPILEDRDRAQIAGREWAFSNDAKRATRRRAYAVIARLRQDTADLLPAEQAMITMGMRRLTTEELNRMFYAPGPEADK